jgi:hypothetical protein
MSDVINLMAEDNRNIIDDDAVPALTLDNTNASGTGLKVTASGGGTVLDIDSTTGTAIDVKSAGGVALAARSQATEVEAASFWHDTAIASPTVAPVVIGTSAASGVLFEFNSGLVSSASIAVMAGAFPVRMVGEDKVVYLVGYEIA